MRSIGLIDCNNFFVSCERVFRPDLVKRPVVVLSSNDGCVVARSQEVKDKGIPMAVPYFQVKDILSDMGTAVFSSHFSLYRDLSRRVFNIVRAEVGQIEQYSIDECFFDIEGDDIALRLSLLRQRLLRETGIPVSIGVASSKTLAKYASEVAKKTDGFCELTPKRWSALLPDVPLSALWGVGRGLSRRFAQRGLVNAQQFVAQPLSFIATNFGVVGARLWHELRGTPVYQVSVATPIPQSHTSSRTFARATLRKSEVRAALSYHLYQVVADLVRTDTCARTLRVTIAPSRYHELSLIATTAETILPLPTNDILQLEQRVTSLFETLFTPGVPYKKAGVSVCTVSDQGATPSLFPDRKLRPSVSALVCGINDRAVRPVIGVRVVPRAGSQVWEAAHEWRSPEYTTRWSDLCVVRSR